MDPSSVGSFVTKIFVLCADTIKRALMRFSLFVILIFFSLTLVLADIVNPVNIVGG